MKLTKKLLSLVLLVVCFFGFFACNGKAEDTLAIAGSPAVKVGETLSLTANTDLKGSVEWTSAAPEVATVDANGTVTGVKEGTAKITAKIGELSAELTVKVYECSSTCPEWTKEQCTEKFPCEACPEVKDWTKEQCEEKYPAEACPELPEFAITAEASKVYVGTAEELLGSITATNNAGWEAKYSYESQDETVVTVDEDGVLTGVAAGTAKVTVSSGDFSTEVDVEVVAPYAKELAIVGQEKVAVDQEVTFEFEFKSDPTPKYEVEWASSNAEVLAIDENGNVEGVAAGTATVTLKLTGINADFGATELVATIDVEVYEATVTNIKLDGQFVTTLGTPSELEVVLLPSFAKFEGDVTVESSDAAVLTVAYADGVVTVTPVAENGVASITVTAGEVTKSFEFRVSAVPLAGGSDGALFNYKYADLETRSSILAALEKWLLNVGYSVPIYSSLSFTLYSDRLTTLSETYVPNMGYGAMYGTVSTGNCAGTEADPAYRAYTTGSPTTLNMFNYQDSVESDILAMVLDGLFAIDFNAEVTGFEMFPSMAEKLAEPVYKDADGKWQLLEGYDAESEDASKNVNLLSSSYRITLRKDLMFTNYKNEKVADITVDDFIYSYKQLLDPLQVNNRADDVFFTSAFEVVGAKDYFEGKGSWDAVGIEKVDSYTFVITATSSFNSWDFHYYNASFLNGPVYEGLYEELKAADGKSTKWGDVTDVSDYSKIDMMVFTGPYVLTYLEDGKEFRFTKNVNFVKNEAIPHNYSFQNVEWAVVKDSNAAFELWEDGQLDAISIPSTKLDEYITNPKIKKAPGSTVFRFNVNTCSQEELYDVFKLSEKDWEAKPILQEKEFRLALSYALDRLGITTTVDKSRQPEIIYMNDAYVIMDGTAGTIYRETAAGAGIIYNPGENDVELLPESYGYSPTKAQDLYTAALTNLIKKGVITAGTADDPTELTIEIALFDGSQMEALGAFLCKNYSEVLNGQKTYPNIHITFSATYHPSLDVYYEKQMTGKFDIGIGGISGSALDPLSYMDVFNDTTDETSSSDKNTLQLTWGIDTNAVEIEWNGLLWSYEALTVAGNGAAFIVNGEEGDSAGFMAVKETGATILEAVAGAVGGEELSADLQAKLDTALEALAAAPSFPASYAALDAGLDALVAGTDKVKLTLVAEFVGEYIAEYGEVVAGLLDEDYVYVGGLIGSYGVDWLVANGYQSYVDYYNTNYPIFKEQLAATALELKAGVTAPASVEEILKYYVEAKTTLYAYYLW